MDDGEKGARPSSVSAKLAVFVVANVAAALLVARGAITLRWAPTRAVIAGLLPGIVTALASSPAFWSPFRRRIRAINDGIQSFREGDFSLRVVQSRGDELGELVDLYNGMADVLRLEKSQIYERELLLDTLLQRA